MSSSRKTKLPSSSPGASVARSGRYHLGEGWALRVGGMKRHALHAHHAYQVSCGIEGTVRLDDAVAPGWIIAPNVPHAIASEGPEVSRLVDEASARTTLARSPPPGR